MAVIAVLGLSLRPAVQVYQGQRVLVPAETNKPALILLVIALATLAVGMPELFILFLFAAFLCSLHQTLD